MSEENYDPKGEFDPRGKGGEDYIIETYARLLTDHGLSDCAYNITACRVSVMICSTLGSRAGREVCLRVLHSEVINAPALFVGFIDPTSEGFSPMLMVMTSEFIGRLRLFCGGEGCDHSTCEFMPDGLREMVLRDVPTPEPVDTTSFAPIVDSIAEELPSFDDLAKFYEIGEDE